MGLRRWQIAASAVYYAVVWFLGLQSGIVGPTLGGMAELLGEGSGTALAPMFTFRACGFLSGTLAVGELCVVECPHTVSRNYTLWVAQNVSQRHA